MLFYFLIRISAMTATIWNALKRGVLEWWSKARKASKNEVKANTKKYIESELEDILGIN